VPNTTTTRHVLVTGASSGIGRATAEHLVQAGFRVFAGVRRDQDVATLRGANLPGLIPILLDVTDSTALVRATHEIDAEVGSRGLAGLVNNAGVSGGGPLEVVDIDLVRACFEVNVIGALAVTRAMLPMLRRGKGRIINMSSGAGRVATPLMGPYCASKFAVEAVSDVLRMELHRSGVAVSTIEPGAVSTSMVGKGNEQIERQIAQLPADAPDYYHHSLLKLRGAFDRTSYNDPEAVAKVVYKALTAARPRTRYVVGGDAKFLLLLRSLFPDRAMDAFLRWLVDL
jgi:NAD(P)-dependent dehydrogenase (short-subunit alcohol dehydrogenase family)